MKTTTQRISAFLRAVPFLAPLLLTGAPQAAQHPAIADLAFTDGSITGRIPALDTSFEVVAEDPERIGVTVHLPWERRLVATIDYVLHKLDVAFHGPDGAPIVISEADSRLLRGLSAAVATARFDEDTRATFTLRTLLALATQFRPGMVIDIHTAPQVALSPSLCDDIGHRVTGSYTKGGQRVVKTKVLGPCAARDCLGRCGLGCSRAPGGVPPYVQRFTQACFDHDLCARYEGIADPGCFDEFEKTFDDYFFAPDCNAVEGDWTVSFNTRICKDGRCESRTFTRFFEFEQPVRKFIGVDPNPDGRKARLSGRTHGRLSKISGSVKIPTYMGEQCGHRPDRFGRAKFKGRNRCGTFEGSLRSGSWPYYNLATCTGTKPGGWSGSVTAGKQSSSSKSSPVAAGPLAGTDER